MSISEDYTRRYLQETGKVAQQIDPDVIDKMISLLVEFRKQGGRLFFLGVGGGAAHASHAVHDARKILGIESYTPTDNVSELTARVNDDGWESVFVNWLKGSRLNERDGVFVFSVGGGNEEKHISTNIVSALKYARSVGAKIFGIVGRDGGYTARIGDAVVIIPTVSQDTVTAHTEAFQMVVWHLIASHPAVRVAEMKWESVNAK